MATKEHGYIKARNKETGVIWEIRPNMLERQDHPWELVDDNDEPIVAKKVDASSLSPEERTIMTAKGLPFSTENAARAALKLKALDENTHAILPVKDGFIIYKV
jgi:hypothetical protein